MNYKFVSKRSYIVRSIAALFVGGGMLTPMAIHSARSASQTWTGGVTDANWNTTNNWGGGAAPGDTASTTNTDVATFNAAIANSWGLAGSPILIDSATQNIGGINFDTAADNYFIGTTAGNSLLLTSGGTIQILNTLTATNASETINAPLVIQGAGGTYTFANNSANGSGAGAGTLNFAGGITGGVAGATVLTLSGSNTNANTISGIIGNGTATTLGITKSGTGTWVLGGANTYTGNTVLNGGTLKYNVDNTAIKTLNFGVLSTTGTGTNNVGSTIVSTIDASTTPSNLTATSINVFTNSATANTINIGTGKTLTSTGGLTLGHNGSLAATLISETARLTVSGGGNFAITGGNVTLGAAQTTNNAANNSVGILDLTALTGSFTANVTTFSLGLGATAAGTLSLGNGSTNTITATTLTIGDSGNNNSGGSSVLTMGTATNVGTYTLQADTINISAGKGTGTLKFFSTSAGTGSVTITNKAGTGNAAITIGNNNVGTGTTITGTLDLRGHTANVSAGAVILGVTTNATGGQGRGILQFDSGTFNATSLSIGSTTGGSTAASITGTSVNIGGGTFMVSGATTIASHSGTVISARTDTLNVTGGTFTTGSLAGAKSTGATAVATNATSNINVSSGILNTGTYLGAVKTAANTGTDTANINVSGGQFNVTGATFQLASQATAGSAVGSLNITGSGAVTSNANITVSGTTTSTITLNGPTAVLNMTGKSIGSAGNLITSLNFQQGTLQNVLQINNGAGLTKTTTGNLIMSGTNSYTGTTIIQAGSLVAGIDSLGVGTSGAFGNSSGGALVLGNGSTLVSDAPAVLINGAFTVGRDITVGSVANAAAYNAIIGGSNTTGTSIYSGAITLNTSAANYTATLQAATGGTVDFQSAFTTNDKAIAIGSTGNTGIVKLTNTLSTTGGISVNFGSLLLNTSDRLGDTTPVTVAGGILDTGSALTDTVSAFNMSSGSLDGTGTITAATYGLSGGTVNALLGTGAVTVSTGTVALGSAGRLSSASSLAIQSGQLTLAGSESVASYQQTGGTLAGAGQTLSSAATYDMQAGAVSANLGGGVGLNKTTGSTVTLSGTNNYSGTTNISAGTLALTGTGTLGTGNVIVNGILDITGITPASYTLGTAQILSGDGTINATGKTLNVNGTLAPGNSPGSLDVTGDVLLAGTTTSNFEIGPSSNDLLAVTGSLTYAGALNINTTETTGSFDLFNFGSLGVGDFSSITLSNAYTGSLTNGGGGIWTGTNGLVTATFTGSTGVLSFAVIPEPSTLVLGGLALLGFAGVGLRRRRMAT